MELLKNTMELNFKSLGQGNPIVVLHGLFGMLDNWMHLGKLLAEEYSVYLVDLRNHGKSPHTDEHSYDLMTDDVVRFMEGQWLHRASVLGHSMGGKVAMQLALQYPEMIEKLIIVDIAPRAYPPRHDDVIGAMQSLDPGEADTRSVMQTHLESQLKDQATIAFLMKNLARRKEGGFQWKMNLPTLVTNYSEVGKEITGTEPFTEDTLFIKGARSDYITDDDWPDVLKLFPNAKLVKIPDAGHWVHADQPEAVLKELMSFLPE